MHSVQFAPTILTYRLDLCHVLTHRPTKSSQNKYDHLVYLIIFIKIKLIEMNRMNQVLPLK